MAGTPGVLSGTFAGRYTIERELGHGASATVYLARDTERSRSVAIKVLKPELAESVGAERFLREIKVHEQLHHPHIVSVLDSGQADGQLYFVLPLMEDGSLRQMLQRDKQLPVEVAVGITRTIADALDYAHKQKLIHRDVKPENILFTSGQACLADFGIARAIERAIDESTTETGLVRGTPAYMSPEQASGSKHYDGRSDVYSLACLLYEMLAGVPAFIGPTPEAVIAQRFQHQPRDLRVYRPSVPSALEAVIQRALSLLPADRYATANDFANALQAALLVPRAEPRTSGPSASFSRQRKWAIAGAGLFAFALIAIVSLRGPEIWRIGSALPDTTKYVILPVEAGDSLPASDVYDQLHQSLGRWSGLSLVSRFEMRKAFGSEQTVGTDRDADRGARRSGAGRYIRARLTGTPGQMTLSAGLFDVGVKAPVMEATSDRVSMASVTPAIDDVIGRLLLRGRAGVNTGSRTLPAIQLYEQALQAREAFNLRRADTLLLAALEHDREFARASLALAEARSWREEPAASWLPWATRAAAGKDLTPSERKLANALLRMARGEYAPACAALQQLAAAQPEDFSLWYSLGTCLRTDNIVIRDGRSVSGWRFRSSYQAAVKAYVRAFELAPALHRTFQAGAYERLRRLLFTGTWSLRSGVSQRPDTTRFYAYASWRSDSLLFVPYPRWMVPRGLIPIDRAGRQTAVAQQRDLFRRIARSWAVALPNNPATKEAVAISLEMFGDPGALDTLKLARSLATDPVHALRLAAEEALMRIAFGRLDARHTQIGVRLADSLLAATPNATRDQITILRPIAALLGRCRLAGHFAAASADPQNAVLLNVPHFAYAAAESLTVFFALGCDTRADTAGVAFVQRSIATGTERSAQTRAEYAVLARAMRLARNPDPLMLERLAQANGDEILAARYAASVNKWADVRAVVARQRSRTLVGAADRSPDAVYPEAELWSVLGDSATARQWLDPVLDRPGWLELILDRPVDAAALLRAACLRADLARGAADEAGAKRWSAIVSALWWNADPELLPITARMLKLAGS